ncbi:MAG: hypothetical protein AB7Q97_25790 [Gammaproteobacteria bacterium]
MVRLLAPLHAETLRGADPGLAAGVEDDDARRQWELVERLHALASTGEEHGMALAVGRLKVAGDDV